jgi:hypothetical protein
MIFPESDKGQPPEIHKSEKRVAPGGVNQPLAILINSRMPAKHLKPGIRLDEFALVWLEIPQGLPDPFLAGVKSFGHV